MMVGWSPWRSSGQAFPTASKRLALTSQKLMSHSLPDYLDQQRAACPDTQDLPACLVLFHFTLLHLAPTKGWVSQGTAAYARSPPLPALTEGRAESVGFCRAWNLGFRSWLQHLASWASYFLSLSLGFFICYMTIKITGCSS